MSDLEFCIDEGSVTSWGVGVILINVPTTEKGIIVKY